MFLILKSWLLGGWYCLARLFWSKKMTRIFVNKVNSEELCGSCFSQINNVFDKRKGKMGKTKAKLSWKTSLWDRFRRTCVSNVFFIRSWTSFAMVSDFSFFFSFLFDNQRSTRIARGILIGRVVEDNLWWNIFLMFRDWRKLLMLLGDSSDGDYVVLSNWGYEARNVTVTSLACHLLQIYRLQDEKMMMKGMIYVLRCER